MSGNKQEDVGAPLTKRQSSLFDMPERKHGPYGTSTTSFGMALGHHEDEGIRPQQRKIRYENTYKLEPPAKFRADMVKPIIEHVLSCNLQDRTYDPIECSLLTKSMASEITARVKELNFERYKIVSIITIGQKNEQSVRIGSRFLWDVDRDNYASSNYENKYIFAIGTVYAVYYE